MAGKQFSFQTYDKRHSAQITERAKRVRKLYDDLAKAVAQIAPRTGFNDPEGTFSLSRYPAVAKVVTGLIDDTLSGILTNAEEAVSDAIDLSASKNDALTTFLATQHRFSEELTKAIQKRNESANEAIRKRINEGMNLSERVWNLKDQLKQELELAMEVGLGQGRSAQALSRDVRQYLQQPNRLFRRVRDKKTGQLRLSKAAAAYHPGRGVYRSSYKNALRMTGTETNIAYRSADCERWKASPMIKGIEVKLSYNHPIEDMCDELTGVYPKNFKFTGWHPQCRCIAMPALVDDKEFEKMSQLSPDEYQKYVSPNEVVSMPKNYNEWILKNTDRIARAKSLPYFISDNYSKAEISKMFTISDGADNKLVLARSEMRRNIENNVKLIKGEPMSIAKADKQNANPHFYEGKEYQINCSATSSAFVLRRWGYDVEAAAWSAGSRIDDFYQGKDYWYKLWKRPDGMQAMPSSVTDWMLKNKVTEMTPERYMSFYKEACKQEGIYIASVGWKKDGGHFTVLIRDSKNNLFRVEPQCDNSKGAPFEHLNLQELCTNGTPTPHKSRGVLRVDDLVFDTSGKNLTMFVNKRP